MERVLASTSILNEVELRSKLGSSGNPFQFQAVLGETFEVELKSRIGSKINWIHIGFFNVDNTQVTQRVDNQFLA